MPKGRAPTTQERLLVLSAETLAPHLSLDRVDKAATAVTASVSIAGTLVAGFGTFAAARLTEVGIGWAAPTVVLAAWSVACAILASVPGSGRVAPGNLIAVEAFFRDEIRRRGRLVRGAGYGLAAAVLLSPTPLVVAAVSDAGSALDVGAQVSADGGVLTATVKASGLDSHGQIRVVVASRGRKLAEAVVDAHPNGAAQAKLTLPRLGPGTPVSITATSRSPSQDRHETIVIPPSSP